MTPTMVADCDDGTRLMVKRGMFDKCEQKIHDSNDDDDRQTI